MFDNRQVLVISLESVSAHLYIIIFQFNRLYPRRKFEDNGALSINLVKFESHNGSCSCLASSRLYLLYYVHFQVDGPAFTPAVNCISEACSTNRAGGRLRQQIRGSKFNKFQEIRVQELVSGDPYVCELTVGK